jgi:hypothetical protein
VRKRWDTILDRLPDGPCSMVEVGVWRCDISRRVLAAHKQVRYFMVDPWSKAYMPPNPRTDGMTQEDYDGLYFGAVALAKLHPHRAVVMRCDSVRASINLHPQARFDLVFLDGDHTRKGVSDDLHAWLWRVNKGGWIGGHDYGEKFPGVKEAVDAAFGDRVELDAGATWWVRV